MFNEVLATIANLALTLFTVASLLALGISLTVKQIVDSLRNGRLLVTILVANFVLVPLLALVITLALPMGDDQKTALILLGTMAGAPFLPLLVQMAKGHMPLAVGQMVLLRIVSIFYAPLVGIAAVADPRAN